VSTAEKVGSDRFSEKGYGTHPSFKTKLRHRRLGYLLHRNRLRPPGLREGPEVVVFDVAPGVTPSEKPPVRIFLGSETAQHRAERIFIWSVAQLRDPARRYEIHMMKHLVGYDRRGWKTGFTNYRYAIPALAGKTGRAIYNDVDQIYLGDPAELFDMEMDGAGVLGINERETSVMLIDCDRMAGLWRLEDAKIGKEGGKNHTYFRGLVHDKGLWGKMPGVWNARDWEYSKGETKLLHYTTLQTQPWRPFKKELRYHESPEGKIWFALEAAADAAGYTVFTAEAPSAAYGPLLAEAEDDLTEARRADLEDHAVPIAKLLREQGGKSLLDCGLGRDGLGTGGQDPLGLPGSEGALVTAFDLAEAGALPGNAAAYDGVLALGCLDLLPEEDVPWLLDRLFSWAERFVYIVAAQDGAEDGSGEELFRDADWWREELEAAARRKPGVAWTLHLQKGAGRAITDKIING
jgi:hypothetical protein